ncbi:MAG: hypothetical protein RLZZ568_186 [Cyanobacteriota bacterium]|jgi:hypothetical protein
MSTQISSQTKHQGKVVNEKQLDEIVGAILAGRYSWACVLVLKFTGYNPLHYIPYRTYHRIVKDNYERKSKQSPQ